MLGALCLSAHAVVLAQSNPADSLPSNFVQIQSPQSGSLAGRLTDLHSAPLARVSIVLRNQATGAEARTTTAKGLTVTCRLDRRKYPTGRQVSDEEMQQINLERNRFHGDWNYVIRPHPKH